jgi:hypothetical protein
MIEHANSQTSNDQGREYLVFNIVPGKSECKGAKIEGWNEWVSPHAQKSFQENGAGLELKRASES